MSDEYACQIYLITPSVIEDEAKFLKDFQDIAELKIVASIQVRLPTTSIASQTSFIKKLMPIAHANDIAVMLCDHVDLAVSLDTDGVHLEMDNSTKMVKSARRIIGQDRMLGVSCGSSRHTAMEAGEAGADYVSFGPVFASKTKALEADPNALDTLLWWNALMELPTVAVGGITEDTAKRAIEHKADFLAVIDYVWAHPEGPVAAVKTLDSAIKASH